MKEMSKLIFKDVIIGIIIIIAMISPVFAEESGITVRDDGLVIVNPESLKNQEQIQHLVMIVRTGYGNDPEGKTGLTKLTNKLLYYIFRYYTNADVGYVTQGDFTAYHFTVLNKNVKTFIQQLDIALRFDVLMDYDFCNRLIQDYKYTPLHPGRPAFENLAEMLYGPGHPYYKVYRFNYPDLNINEVNKWFRLVYRPNNIIISSSFPIPEDFLRRPTGKNFNEPVNLAKIPQPKPEPDLRLKYVINHDNSSLVCMGFAAPKMGEENFFGALLGKIYLADELTNQLREKNGFVYYVEPDYTAISESSAPTLIIYFQTLPGDTGAVIQETIDILKELAKNGIPKEKLARIIASEKKRLELQSKFLAEKTWLFALQALYNQEWISNSNEYLTKLDKASETVSKVFAAGLPSLKISIAGPAETEASLKNINF